MNTGANEKLLNKASYFTNSRIGMGPVLPKGCLNEGRRKTMKQLTLPQADGRSGLRIHRK